MTITLDTLGAGIDVQTDYALLQNIPYDVYARLRQQYAEEPLPRLTYDRGKLEIVGVNSALHEFLNRLLAALVERLAEEWEIEFLNVGSTTLQRRDLAQGLEPDTAFYLRNLDRIRGRHQLDLEAGDPPPDLVIEIDYTSYSLDKLPLYAALGVPEIWRFTRRERIEILHQVEGNYVDAAVSIAFPALTRDGLNDLFAQGRTMDRLQWLRAVRNWVRSSGEGSR